MDNQSPKLPGARIDVCSLEADMAFFEARLSLAEGAPDTRYQRAQIKAYKTLGRLLGETLSQLRPPAKSPPAAKGRSAAA
ncbi:MAG: hypothetical protein PVJ03_11565 [Chromatiaceae bacterium]|jgi:hypothetical protein